MSEAAHCMRSRGSAVYISVGCHGDHERDARHLVSAIKKLVTIYQRRAGARPLWFEVLEACPEFHSHMVVAMPSLAGSNDLIERLHRSKQVGSRVVCKRVWYWQGLINYLSKEATSQAWYGAGKSFKRVKNACRDGRYVSGDRVRVSAELERLLVATGNIEPRLRTYAARLPVGAYEQQPTLTSSSPAPSSAVATTPEGSVGENPLQLAFALALPPAVDLLQLAEEKRLALGLSQRAVASIVGFRQPQWSNAVVRRHDTLSPWARNRLREFVRLAA